jgi:hypothetical protein
MNLATKYLGLTLAHPFMVGASPLADDLDMSMARRRMATSWNAPTISARSRAGRR